MAYQYDAFISYRRDKITIAWTEEVFLPQFEHRLREALGKKEVRIFLDTREIEGADYWATKLKTALAHSKCLVPILLPTYFDSEWCIREFAIFLNRQKKLQMEPKGLILPFVVNDGSMFPEAAKAIQACHCHDFYFTGKAFLNSKGHLKFQKKMNDWMPQVANCIENAPDWHPDSDTENWSDVEWEHLRLPKKLKIERPHFNI